MACKFCEQRGKTWDGSDPKCAFEDGVFSKDNWNCATMNSLREIRGGDWDCCVEEQRYAMIPVEYGVLVMSWYKDRGATDTAIIIDLDGDVTPLHIAQAERLVDYYLKDRKDYKNERFN